MMYDYNDGDSNPKNSQGLTPLMYAAKNNNAAIVNFLTQRKIDLNEEDKHGMTILVHCLRKGSKEDSKMARKLVARGADVNWIDKNGNTPLLTFVQLEKPEQVRFLLEKKASQHICDEEGKDACDYAKANGLASEPGFEQFMSCSIHLKREAERLASKRDRRADAATSRAGSGRGSKRRGVGHATDDSKNGTFSVAQQPPLEAPVKQRLPESKSKAAEVKTKSPEPQPVRAAPVQPAPAAPVQKVIEKVDPDLTAKVQKQIEQMNKQHLDEMQKMMTVIKSQSIMKDGEIKKVVEEKNKQIELLKKSEKEKENMNYERMHKCE